MKQNVSVMKQEARMAEYKRIAVDPEIFQEIVAAASRSERSIGGQVAFMVKRMMAMGLWDVELSQLPQPEGAVKIPLVILRAKEGRDDDISG